MFLIYQKHITAASSPKSVYLNCHTYFSLRYGMIAPDELVAAATAKGIDTLVLTDINNTSAAFPFIQACKTAGIKPLLGIEFRRDHQLLYIGIAKNWEGFFQLNQFLSAHSFTETPLPDIAPELPDTYIIYEFQKHPKPLADFRTNELIGVRHHQLTDLYFSNAEKYPEKLVALSPVTFLNETHFKIHQILRTIDLNILISQLTITDIANREELLYSKKELLERYKLYPKMCFLIAYYFRFQGHYALLLKRFYIPLIHLPMCIRGI